MRIGGPLITQCSKLWDGCEPYSQLDDLEQFPQSCSLSQEHERFPFELRDKLVGKGSRRRYRAIFTIDGGTVIVLTVRAAEEGDLNPSDLAAS